MTWTVSLKLRYRQNEEYWSKSNGKDQGHKVMVQVNCSLSPSLPYLSSLSYLYAIRFLLNELNVKHRQTDGRKEYRHIYTSLPYTLYMCMYFIHHKHISRSDTSIWLSLIYIPSTSIHTSVNFFANQYFRFIRLTHHTIMNLSILPNVALFEVTDMVTNIRY